MSDNRNNNEFLRKQLELLVKKKSGENIKWQDIADFRAMNNDGVSEHVDNVRKGYLLLKDYVNNGWLVCPGEEQQEKDESKTIANLQKERVKLADQRAAYKKLIRDQARKESFLEMVKDVICENVEPININIKYETYNSECDLLCHLTDIHTGIEINNMANEFNQDILTNRIKKYTSEICDIAGMHYARNCYIVIGEIVSGIIHNNLRLQNNMDLMEQFKYISELISGMLTRLAYKFNEIHVYVTAGNHSRISPKKEDSLSGENMDVLLPFYLQARLQNIKNIKIHEQTLKNAHDMALFNVRGHNVVAVHGDKDKPSDVVQNMTMLLGYQPDIIMMGHRHTNGLHTEAGTKVIQSGSVSGTDDYAISIRKYNPPEQTISVIDDKGLLCFYNVNLE